MTNDAMRTQWNEASGPEWVALEQQFDQMLTPIGKELLRRAAARPGEHVLDVGCGFGSTTLALAAAVGPDGRVMGLDISAPLLRRAHERAHEAGVHNIIWDEADAQEAKLPTDHFDLVTSRFGVMFFEQPVVAFHNFFAATKPGGRLCFACWQSSDRNPWYTFASQMLAAHIELPPPPFASGPGPFAFGDRARLAAILTTAGFTDVTIDTFMPMLVMGGDRDDALDFMVHGPIRAALDAAPAEARDAGIAAARAGLRERSVDREVRFPAAVWMVSARRP